MALAEIACAAALLAAAPGSDPPSASVLLRWAPVPGATAYDVQVAPDAAFAAPAVAERVAETSYRWRRTPVRRFRWRVRSVDSAGRPGAWSATRTVEPAVEPPRQIAPPDGARVGAGAVELSCVPSPFLVSYSLEVARDPSFAKRVHEESGPACAFRPALAEAGRFHWRVSGKTADGDSTPPSPSRALDVSPPAPALLDPAPGAAAPFAPLLLRWSPVLGALEYRVAVSGPGGRRLLTVKEPPLELPPERSGPHAWTVAAVGPGGVAGPEARPRTVEIGLPAPVPQGPAPGEVLRAARAAEVDFTWMPVADAASYAIELVRDGSGDVAWRAEGPEPRARADVAPGAYSWRVVARDSSGRAGPPSPPRPLSVELSHPPIAPSPAPASATVAVAGPSGPARSARWPISAGAAAAWRTNLAGFSRPGPILEIGLRSPVASGALVASLRAGWFETSATVPSSSVLPSPVRASAQLWPVVLLATYERRFPSLAVYAGAGPAAWIARVAAGGEVLLRLSPGAEALVGLARPLRSGEAFLEVGGALGELSTSIVRLRTGGVQVSAGWRAEL